MHHNDALLPPPLRCSPLKGTGIPPLDTTEIYVSAYLDRLLGVNQDDYRWEGMWGLSATTWG